MKGLGSEEERTASQIICAFIAANGTTPGSAIMGTAPDYFKKYMDNLKTLIATVTEAVGK